MKLTKEAIEQINTVRMRLLIALSLNSTEAYVVRLIKENKNNGALTKAAAIDVIRRETGMNDEQILDKELAPQN